MITKRQRRDSRLNWRRGSCSGWPKHYRNAYLCVRCLYMNYRRAIFMLITDIILCLYPVVKVCCCCLKLCDQFCRDHTEKQTLSLPQLIRFQCTKTAQVNLIILFEVFGCNALFRFCWRWVVFKNTTFSKCVLN